ncbi:hypothetical protein [Kribbella sp. NPDC006257]
MTRVSLIVGPLIPGVSAFVGPLRPGVSGFVGPLRLTGWSVAR